MQSHSHAEAQPLAEVGAIQIEDPGVDEVHVREPKAQRTGQPHIHSTAGGEATPVVSKCWG